MLPFVQWKKQRKIYMPEYSPDRKGTKAKKPFRNPAL
jgi:hypothetical protein